MEWLTKKICSSMLIAPYVTFYLFVFCQLKVGFCLSEELVRKVNELSAEHERDDGTQLSATKDGDRKLVFKQDLKVEFSNNTTQVMDVISVTLVVKGSESFAASPLVPH